MNEDKYVYYYGPEKNMEPKKEETTVINKAPTNGYDVASSAITTTGVIAVVLGICYGLYKICSAPIELVNNNSNNGGNAE